MQHKKKILFILLALFVFSCKSHNQNYIIIFKTANGLKEGSPVFINDFQVGEVKNIKLNSDYKIQAEIQMCDTIRLPKDTKFSIKSKDLFTKSISIIPGKSDKILRKNDKIIGLEEKNLKLDTILNKIQEKLQ